MFVSQSCTVPTLGYKEVLGVPLGSPRDPVAMVHTSQVIMVIYHMTLDSKQDQIQVPQEQINISKINK